MFNNNTILEMLSLVSIAGNCLPKEEVEIHQIDFFEVELEEIIEGESSIDRVERICAKYADELPF